MAEIRRFLVSELNSNRTRGHGPGKRLRTAAAVVWAGVGLAIWATGRFNSEAQHNGKPISDWVDQVCSRPNEFEAQQEVRKIGAPAIPYLIAKLKSGETWLDRMLFAIREKLPTPFGRLTPAPHKGPFDRSCAAQCLILFVEDAKRAVLALAKL